MIEKKYKYAYIQYLILLIKWVICCFLCHVQSPDIISFLTLFILDIDWWRNLLEYISNIPSCFFTVLYTSYFSYFYKNKINISSIPKYSIRKLWVQSLWDSNVKYDVAAYVISVGLYKPMFRFVNSYLLLIHVDDQIY